MSDRKQAVGTRRGNGAGKGAGWGGPAKGAGTRFAKGEAQPLQGKSNTAPVVSQREARIAALKDKLFALATDAAREETQLAAAVAYLNREEGLPVARQISATVDDARMVVEIVRFADDPPAE